MAVREHPSDGRTRIVAAAARLLRRSGPAAVTTRGVAEAAGVQAPAIYRLFGDKDGLLDAVAEHVLTQWVTRKAAAVAAVKPDDDPLQELYAAWQLQLDFGVSNPHLFRLLTDPDRALRSPAFVAGKQMLEQRVQRVAAAGLLRVSESRAVALIQAAGTGAVFTLLATAPQARDDGLPDALWLVVEHAIVRDAAPPEEHGPKVAAIALRALAPQLTSLTRAEQLLLREWLDRTIEAT